MDAILILNSEWPIITLKNLLAAEEYVRLSPWILLEKVDAEDIVARELIVLLRGGGGELWLNHYEFLSIKGIACPETQS